MTRQTFAVEATSYDQQTKLDMVLSRHQLHAGDHDSELTASPLSVCGYVCVCVCVCVIFNLSNDLYVIACMCVVVIGVENHVVLCHSRQRRSFAATCGARDTGGRCAALLGGVHVVQCVEF